MRTSVSFLDVTAPSLDDERRTRLLAGAAVTLRELSEVLTPLGEKFASAGHELYLVGGSVRDAILGRLGTDLDFTTDARPEQVQKLLSGWADNQWDTGIDFGTISAAKAGQQIEITDVPGRRVRPGVAQSRRPVRDETRGRPGAA